MIADQTYYEILHVVPEADPAVIKAAYRARIKTLHPDLGGSAEATIALTAAYHVLADETQRERYDHELGLRRPSRARYTGGDGQPWVATTRATPARSALERGTRVVLAVLMTAGYLATSFH